MNDSVWYFAYGSNLDQERFRSRVCDFREIRRASLPGWRLRFSSRVQSEGGGGAIIEPRSGARVNGAVFLVSRAQIEAMDAEEFDPRRDPERLATRHSVTVETADGPLATEVYSIGGSDRGRRPSRRYLEHITRGLRQAGYDDEVVSEVEAAAAAEPPADSISG